MKTGDLCGSPVSLRHAALVYVFRLVILENDCQLTGHYIQCNSTTTPDGQTGYLSTFFVYLS